MATKMANKQLKRDFKTLREQCSEEVNLCGYVLGETIGQGSFGKVKRK